MSEDGIPTPNGPLNNGRVNNPMQFGQAFWFNPAIALGPFRSGRWGGWGEDDRACATRLARYCARNPVALVRLTYDRAAKAVTYRSDTSEGPTAGTETADPLEFLARVLVHIPDKVHVTTRYYGWYANRPRAMRRQAEPAPCAPPAIVAAPRLAPTEASRRWATLLQQSFEVDPLACPTCHGAMREAGDQGLDSAHLD